MNLLDIPEALINYDIENDHLLYTISDMSLIISTLITKDVLDSEVISSMIDDYDLKIGEILEHTLDHDKILITLIYLTEKLITLFDLSIEFECYETTQNIKKWNELYA